MATVLRVSNRRKFLVTMGLSWAAYGALGILRDPRYGTARGLSHITEYVPLVGLGWMWIAFGAVAVVAGLLKTWPRIQSAGFVALAVPPALWGAAYTVAWSGGGFPSAIGSAVCWVGFSLGIVWVSGMDDRQLRSREKV